MTWFVFWRRNAGNVATALRAVPGFVRQHGNRLLRAGCTAVRNRFRHHAYRPRAARPWLLHWLRWRKTPFAVQDFLSRTVEPHHVIPTG